MTGIIVTTPPTVELPPGSTSSNPATLPPVTYTFAVLSIPQTWTAKQTFPLGMITLNAADITGTLPFGVMPLPSTTTLGGIFSKAAIASQWINSIGTTGLPTSSQPAFTDISGSIAATQIPAFTGDITTVAGTVATTLATVNANVGTFGSATQSVTFTTNAKGLMTAAANVTITPAIGSITGLGANVATFLATPSSANFAAAVTGETGTGAVVFDTSPALTGTPTAPTAAAGTNTTQIATTAGIVAERAATKVLTNTTLNSTATGNVLQVSGVTVSAGQYPGTTTNDSATAGNVGELLSSTILVASAVSLTSGVVADVTSLVLTAGDWDFWGDIWMSPGGTTTSTLQLAWVNITSATNPAVPALSNSILQIWMNTPAGGGINMPTGMATVKVATTQTVFLSTFITFAVSTMKVYGTLWARRRR